MYCKMYEHLDQFFKMERGPVACTDIDGLMQTLNINHIPLDWRLFIDSSKLSLKAVLLHNVSTLTSIHYSRKDWPARKSLEPGIMNVENQPLVELSKILLPSMHLNLGLTKKICKGHEPRRSCLYLLTRKVSQTKWGKIERRCFHWSTNTRPYQGRIVRQAPSRGRKGGLGQF